MKNTIIALLLKAKAWQCATEIQLAIGARSRANVILVLRELETQGHAVSRPGKDSVGNKTEQWRHATLVNPTPNKAPVVKPGAALDLKLIAALQADVATKQAEIAAIQRRLKKLGATA